MAHQKKYRNIQSMQQARMNHACCVGLNCGWAFCPNLQPFTYQQLKQHQETKINKTRLFLPLILSTNLIKRKSKIAYLQDTIWDHLDWEPAVHSVHALIGRVFRFYMPIRKVLEQPQKHFTSLKLQVFSNPTPIIQSSINQQNKNKPPLA